MYCPCGAYHNLFFVASACRTAEHGEGVAFTVVGWFLIFFTFFDFFWTYVDVAASNCVNTIWLLSSSNVFREETGWRWFILQFFMVESKSERVDILSHTGCYLDFRHEAFNSMKVSTAIGFNPMKELLLWMDHQLDFAVYSSSGCVYMFPASGSPRPPPMVWSPPPYPVPPYPAVLAVTLVALLVLVLRSTT